MSTILPDDIPERLGYRKPGKPKQVMPGEPHEGIVIAATLGRIEHELRRIRSLTPQPGRQFARQDGGQATGGVLNMVFEGPKTGASWFVERVTISAAGASAAGTVALYSSQAVDESELLDFLGALTGNTPSRGKLDGNGTPYFIYGGGPLLVAVAGVVAGGQVLARVQGRELLASADIALRPQVET